MKTINEKLFQKIAQDIEDEWKMGGLSGGIYEDYAREILKRYLELTPTLSPER